MACDFLNPLKPLDVYLETLSPRTRPASGAGIGCLSQYSLDRLWLYLIVVGFNGVNDFLRFSISASNIGTNQCMTAFHLMRERFSNIVKERPSFDYIRPKAQLRSHYPGDMS